MLLTILNSINFQFSLFIYCRYTSQQKLFQSTEHKHAHTYKNQLGKVIYLKTEYGFTLFLFLGPIILLQQIELV